MRIGQPSPSRACGTHQAERLAQRAGKQGVHRPCHVAGSSHDDLPSQRAIAIADGDIVKCTASNHNGRKPAAAHAK
jgi:hypothetical protein